jgi:hypothetical protein
MAQTTTPIDLASRRRVVAVPPATLAGLPLMLTVTEAAAVLRISRTSAYKLAEEWRYTKGTSGLPTVRLGARLLVRRVDLAVIVGLDPTG